MPTIEQPSFVAVYNGEPRGNTEHQQVDTGLRFSCDVEILDHVLALNRNGVTTWGSCQSDGFYYIKRRWISFRHPDPHRLLDICLAIRTALIDKNHGWSQKLVVDSYFIPSDPSAFIDWVPDLDALMLETLNNSTA